MTTIDYAASAPVSARPSRGIRAVFNAPGLFLKRHFVALHTRNELSGLSDRQLDDIGLTRSNIDSISRETATRATF